MKAITLTLETQQPILATSFQGDPNSDVSYPYIPGSMIRGAIIGRYMRQHHLSELDLTNDKVKRLFFDAKSTRYLNAYLLNQKNQRTLPLPLSWFKDKDAELTDKSSITVYDFSVDKGEEPETPKPVGEYFWAKEGGIVKLYKEKRRINIHNFRDRKKGRSTDNQGELFRYDALDAGQTFQSIILCEDDNVETIHKLLAEPNFWLGGSQSAGYGHTKISVTQPSSDNWNEIGIAADDRKNDETLDEHIPVKLAKSSSASSLPPLRSEGSRLLAEQMAQRLLEQKLEQYLQKKVGYLSLDEGISTSQLSRLQSVAQQALPNGDCNLVISLLNNLPSNARNQFERTKIGNENPKKSFKQKLDEWLLNPTDWINGIEVKIADVDRKFDDDRARQDKLAEKYTLRLIMAVAKKATKERN